MGTASYGFAAPFIWKEGQPATAMRPVIQASIGNEKPVPAFLFGPAPKTGDVPKLTARLELIPNTPRQWELVITGTKGSSPTGSGTAGATDPGDITWELITNRFGKDDAAQWFWQGGLGLKWVGKEGETTAAAVAAAKIPRIVFELGRQVTKLIPSEVWCVAGGSHLSEALSIPADDGYQIWQAVPGGGPILWERALNPGRVATAFARERKKMGTYQNFQVTVISVVSARSFLAGWRLPESTEAPTAALWSTPFEKPEAGDLPSASSTPKVLPFGCRGLVWWHGGWEADCHPDVSDEALAARGMKAVEAFRARYSEDLKEFLTVWWGRYKFSPVLELPEESGAKPEEKAELAVKNGNLVTLAEEQLKEMEIRVVQLPSTDHRTVADEGFRAMATGEFSLPLSTWSAVRYAQYDVVSELKGDPLKIPGIRLYPLLPTAAGAPGYQHSAADVVTPLAGGTPVVADVPGKAWLTSYGARGVESQLEEVGAALARKLGGALEITPGGRRLTITGLQTAEPNSNFNFAPLFEGLPSHKPPTSLKFEEKKLLIDFEEGDRQFRTRAVDRAFTIRGPTGELMPAFSIQSH